MKLHRNWRLKHRKGIKMNKYIGIFLIGMTIQTNAQELTLNNLPKILYDIRGCKEHKNLIGTNSIICQIPDKNLWATINSKGELTLFQRKDYGGDTTYAYGKNIKELLQDYATKINNNQALNKTILENLVPYLATQ